MCKAGFAGDDAPRAVFRKFNPTEYDTPPCEGHPTNPCVGWLPLFCLAGKNLESENQLTNKLQQPLLSVVPVTMGKSSPPFWLILAVYTIYSQFDPQ